MALNAFRRCSHHPHPPRKSASSQTEPRSPRDTHPCALPQPQPPPQPPFCLWDCGCSGFLCKQKEHHVFERQFTQHPVTEGLIGRMVGDLVTKSCPTLCDPMDCRPPRLLSPWGFLGKNTRVGCQLLLQGIFPTQGSNPGLLHCRQILYRLSHQGGPGSVGGEESSCRCRRPGRQRFDPWAGEIPWRRRWQPAPVLLLQNPMDRGAWRASVHRVTRSRT